MSLTAVAWILLFVYLAVRAVSQPIYGVYLYMQTFFAAPQFWWWGEGFLMGLTSRWNLIASLVLVVSVLVNRSKIRKYSSADTGRFRTCIFLLTTFAVNAVVVHILLADYPQISFLSLDLVLKQLALAVLLFFAIQSLDDLDAFLTAIFVGCVFVGYQVVVNDAGNMIHGRLEGIGIPGVSSANGASSILIAGLSVGGYQFLRAKGIVTRAGIAFGCVLILDTVLRCNSRGAFLGLGCAGMWMAVSTTGKPRKLVLGGLLLGAVAVLIQARDEFIWSRFDTTFAEADERDGSANERIDYWNAGLAMLGDYPFGSGGEAGFKSPRGMTYITHIRQDQFRSVHNGYLDIAIAWGVQGFMLLISCLTIAFWSVWRKTRQLSKSHIQISLLGATIQAFFVSQFVTAIFLSRLDHEVFYWLVAIGTLYHREALMVESAVQPGFHWSAEHCATSANAAI